MPLKRCFGKVQKPTTTSQETCLYDTHPNACEERLDAHAFLWRPFHPPQFAAGDFVLEVISYRDSEASLAKKNFVLPR